MHVKILKSISHVTLAGGIQNERRGPDIKFSVGVSWLRRLEFDHAKMKLWGIHTAD